jgi:acetyltransferase-like isoleucine patch superfamily enzyme
VYAFEGRKAAFGDGSAISDGVTVRTSDSHPIYALHTGERVNNAADVAVGENVWVCSGATLLKGAGVGNGCVVGLKSILTKDFSDKNNILLAGAPAKIIKENIKWEFEFKS